MIRAVHIVYLRLREVVLLGQIENGEALLRSHRASLLHAHGALRRVRSKLSTITPGRQLVAHALRSRASTR